jgi:NAD(P)-dependent dehydrogenase (short-subunit alcohol dehydrogenase family)
MTHISGKRVVVTGASRGLGYAVARALLQRGARVAVCSRDAEKLGSLFEAYGDQVIYAEVDLERPQTIELFATTVLDKWHEVDAVVNNASTLGENGLKPLVDSKYTGLDSAMRVNYLGAFKMISVFLPAMLTHRRGVIVNVTSDVVPNPSAGWGPYGASKAALEYMSRVLAEELREFGVKVYLYDPGDMDTELHWQALPQDDASQLLKPDRSAEPIVRLVYSEVTAVSGSRLSVYDFDMGDRQC